MDGSGLRLLARRTMLSPIYNYHEKLFFKLLFKHFREFVFHINHAHWPGRGAHANSSSMYQLFFVEKILRIASNNIMYVKLATLKDPRNKCYIVV